MNKKTDPSKKTYFAEPHVKLRDLYNFKSVAWLNHATLYEAWSKIIFPIVAEY